MTTDRLYAIMPLFCRERWCMTTPPGFSAPHEQLARITDSLAQHGYGIFPALFDAATCHALATECRREQQAGEFRPAGVGRGDGWMVREDIRSDHIRWLSPNDCGEQQGHYLAWLEAYRQVLNQELFLGLVEFEGHGALYPPGSFYQRHLDQFRGNNQRTVTAILYLNEDWRAEDGGQLRIELEDGKTLEVLPEQGTFVTFMSERYWHEVLPATRDRLSLTGWFKTRPIDGSVGP